MVTFANSTWLANGTFQSGATFNSANWLVLAAHGNTELGYAERTTDFTTTSTVMADVTGLSKTVTITDRPVMVIFEDDVKHSAANGITVVQLMQGATQIAVGQRTSPTASAIGHLRVVRRQALPPGDYTFKVQASISQFGTAGTSTLLGNATTPSFLQIVEV